VGARNLAECLTLQLKALDADEEGDPDTVQTALTICQQPLEMLARRDIRRRWPADTRPNDLTLYRWLERACQHGQLCRDYGVIAMLVVAPTHRRRGIARELVRRAEDYLRSGGSTVIYAGSMPPPGPFFLGL